MSVCVCMYELAQKKGRGEKIRTMTASFRALPLEHDSKLMYTQRIRPVIQEGGGRGEGRKESKLRKVLGNEG